MLRRLRNAINTCAFLQIVYKCSIFYQLICTEYYDKLRIITEITTGGITMLYSTVPCPPGVRAKKRGASTPGKSQGGQTNHHRASHKEVVSTCVREGNRAVPALRMYKKHNEGKQEGGAG